MSDRNRKKQAAKRGQARAAVGKPNRARDIRHLAARSAEPAGRPGSFPIVGLGASAGGLAALEEFFSAMPPDSGMAFVVITHLHQGQPSLLHELVGRKTSMPVTEIKKATVVQPNHVYTVTPGRNLAILNGTLQPMPRNKATAVHLPIDYFFRSLAQDQKYQAIGIVLSGTGSDGTLGLKEIKSELGMVMAQQEQSASYTSMPESAIATGLVDFVVAPKDMPDKLLGYATDAIRRSGRIGPSEPEGGVRSEDLQQIFVLLRARTGHDFSQYKSSTIDRRLERRMSVHHAEDVSQYLRLLQEDSDEVDRLFKELLIGVTSFFRDPAGFEALAGALRKLLSTKPADYPVRVWVPGCSTGEEAYSIAILLREYMEQAKKPLSVQIFATDLDPDAIDVARAGLYPVGIAQDVSSSRLKRFFTREQEAFRIAKELREMVVFAPQNLIEDPPFTKVDLLSCRNLLIYLDGALQRRLFPIFHYALRPGGILFLGSSETVGSFGYLFATRDKKWKVFERKEVAQGTYAAELPAGIRGTPPPADRPTITWRQPELALTQGADRLIVQELVPPTVLVREQGDIVHIRGRTGLFLEPTQGPQPASNIFNMARDGLPLELASLIRQAVTTDTEVIRRDVRFKPNGSEMLVDLRARRLVEPEPFRGILMISFEGARPIPDRSDAEATRKSGRGKSKGARSAKESDRMAELELDLRFTKQSLQKTIEEAEATNEQLKATNEELQSTNEELQSANEELETSKEEMQSLNEELQTVNAELQGKVEELSRANDDMKNLLNSTDIATIFLDSALNITRYTEQAKRIMRLIPSDVGRPIEDLAPRLRYDHLGEDTRQVLSTLVYKELDIQGEDRSWYFMRILPYRTTDNVIDGLVMTFTDITKIKALQADQDRLLEALKHSPTAVSGQDRELRYFWIHNPAFARPAEAILGRTDDDLFDPDDARRLTAIKRRVLETETPTRHTIAVQVNRERRVYDLYVEPIRDDKGAVIGVSSVHTDITPAVIGASTPE